MGSNSKLSPNIVGAIGGAALMITCFVIGAAWQRRLVTRADIAPDGSSGVMLLCETQREQLSRGGYRYWTRWVGCTHGDECVRKLREAGCDAPAVSDGLRGSWKVYDHGLRGVHEAERSR